MRATRWANFVAHLRGGQINHLAGPGQRLGLGQPAFAARAANKNCRMLAFLCAKAWPGIIGLR